MGEKTYTQKQLYEFVTEYSREAREEGFDMSVGDFVDWVASRDEKQEEDPECMCLCHNQITKYDHRGSSCCDEQYREEQKDKPVLPEKLSIHDSRDMSNPDDVLDILLETQAVINTIVYYLKEKNI